MTRPMTEREALRGVALAAGNALPAVRDPVKRRALRESLRELANVQTREAVAAAEAEDDQPDDVRSRQHKD